VHRAELYHKVWFPAVCSAAWGHRRGTRHQSTYATPVQFTDDHSIGLISTRYISVLCDPNVKHKYYMLLMTGKLLVEVFCHTILM